MIAKRWPRTIVFGACMLGVYQIATAEIRLPRELLSYDIGNIESVNGVTRGNIPATATGPLSVQITSPRWTGTLRLVPRQDESPRGIVRYFSKTSAREEEIPALMYTGTIDNESVSRLSLALIDGGLAGMIRFTDGRELWLEPLRKYDASAAATALLIYSNADIDHGAYPELRCGHDVESFEVPVKVPADDQMVAGASIVTPGAQAALSLGAGDVKGYGAAVVVDWQFRTAFSSEQAARDNVTALIELVNDIYMPEVGAALRHPVIDIPTSSGADPYPISGSTTGTQIMTMTTNYRSSHPTHLAQGVTLGVINATYSGGGANPPIGTLGTSNGKVCEAAAPFNYPSTWMQGLPINVTLFVRTALMAHELGHAMGAGHDDDASACPPPLFEDGRICVTGPFIGKSCQNSLTDCSTANQVGDCNLPANPVRRLMYHAISGVTVHDFSLCSKLAIEARLTSTSKPTGCLQQVPCGDVNGSGTVTATDANEALALAGCPTCDFNGLADVLPQPTPNLLVTNQDASYILDIAVGIQSSPSNCGS